MRARSQLGRSRDHALHLRVALEQETRLARAGLERHREAAERKTYFATLQLTNGEELRLTGTSKEMAIDMARTIRDFLRAKPATS